MREFQLDTKKDKKRVLFIFLGMNLLLVFIAVFVMAPKPYPMANIIIVIVVNIAVLAGYIWFVRNVFHSYRLKYLEKISYFLASSFSFLHMVIFTFAEIAYRLGVRVDGINSTIDKLDAYYFSIVTFTTLGYGDLSPKVELRLIFAIEALVGYLFFGLMVGLMVSLAVMKEENPNKALKSDS